MARSTRPQRSAQEQAVHDLFQGNGAYGGYGVCAVPGCDTSAYCMGAHPQARICIACFEFTFKCSFPSRKKLDGMRARQ